MRNEVENEIFMAARQVADILSRDDLNAVARVELQIAYKRIEAAYTDQKCDLKFRHRRRDLLRAILEICASTSRR